MNYIELVEKIKRIDENAYFSGEFKPGTRANMTIVGASALLLSDLSSKSTTKDVDVLEAEQSIRTFMAADPDFNTRCNAYVQCLPYNFPDRQIKINLDTFLIDVWVPSMEDLAVMKLYRWEKPDINDLTAPEFLARLNWDLLDHLVYSPEEAAASRSAEPEKDTGLRNLRFNYSEYKRGWRQ